MSFECTHIRSHRLFCGQTPQAMSRGAAGGARTAGRTHTHAIRRTSGARRGHDTRRLSAVPGTAIPCRDSTTLTYTLNARTIHPPPVVLHSNTRMAHTQNPSCILLANPRVDDPASSTRFPVLRMTTHHMSCGRPFGTSAVRARRTNPCAQPRARRPIAPPPPGALAALFAFPFFFDGEGGEAGGRLGPEDRVPPGMSQARRARNLELLLVHVRLDVGERRRVALAGRQHREDDGALLAFLATSRAAHMVPPPEMPVSRFSLATRALEVAIADAAGIGRASPSGCPSARPRAP